MVTFFYRHWLLGEQLRGRTNKTVRVQENGRTHFKNRRFGVPRRPNGRGMQRALSKLSFPLPLIWPRWHWRPCMPSFSSLPCDSRWHPGNNGFKQRALKREVHYFMCIYDCVYFMCVVTKLCFFRIPTWKYPKRLLTNCRLVTMYLSTVAPATW